MRIRVPLDQIELLNAEINKIESRLAQNRSILNKAWTTILLESLVKDRINAKFVQSNMLAGRIQSTDAYMTKYLKRVVSDFLEADNRNTSIIKKLAGSSKVLSRDGAVSIRDRLLNSRKMYIALALLGPLALLYPAATALGWIKERMAAKGPHQPTPEKVDKKPKREQSQPLREQTTGGPEPLTTEEQEQLARNGMTEEQFRRWQEETGWRSTPENPGGWPALPESIDKRNFSNPPEQVDSFYGIPAYAKQGALGGYGFGENIYPLGSFNNEDGTYVPEENGLYNCAEYVKRFYSQNGRHGLFGEGEGNIISNVTNLTRTSVFRPEQNWGIPLVHYNDGRENYMVQVDLPGQGMPQPGDVVRFDQESYYHWAIVKGVDVETNQVIIIEQNFGNDDHQPERRVPIDSADYFRIER